jgi:hypothetical protein
MWLGGLRTYRPLGAARDSAPEEEVAHCGRLCPCNFEWIMEQQDLFIRRICKERLVPLGKGKAIHLILLSPKHRVA